MQAKTAFLGLTLLSASAFGAPALAASPTPIEIGSAVIDQARPAPALTAAPREKLVETGIATWYGKRHSKHYTVSGERFDPSQMTAAHRSLPIGTMVRVTDRDTGRSIIVRVNDREPPHGRRCIDLSEGAARALGIHRQGIANVQITALNRPDAVEVAEAPDDTVTPEHAPAPPRAVTHRRRAKHAG